MSANENRKKQANDSQLVLRLPKVDRDAFVDLCDGLDTTAAREIRRFIREFTATHGIRSEAGPGEPTSQSKPSNKKQAIQQEKGRTFGQALTVIRHRSKDRSQ